MSPILTTGVGNFPAIITGGGEGTVLFDSKNTYKIVNIGLDSNSFTVPATANRVLVACISFDGGIPSPGTINPRWDSAATNQLLTKIADVSNAGLAVQIWGLVAPTSGAHTLTLTWTVGSGGGGAFVQLACFTNVDQTTPFPNFNTGTATTTINVTSQSNRKVVGCIGSVSDPVGVTSTPLYYDSTTGTTIYAGASYDTGAATKAIGATNTAACVAAIDIKGI